MDNEKLDLIKDPKFYLENFVKIKGKTPGLIPFVLNEAQKDLFNTLNRSTRVIICKARQLGFCGSKDTPILTSNLEWIRLGDIQVGQEIVCVDENVPGGKGKHRKMRTGIVEKKCYVEEESIRIELEDGRTIDLTPGHRMMSRNRGCDTVIWKKIGDMKIGDEMRSITEVWNNGDYEDGWFGGIIDGEGSLAKPSRTGGSLNVAQVDGGVWDNIKKYAEKNKIEYRVEVDRRDPGTSSKFGSKNVNKLVISKMSDMFKVIGKTRPVRMVGKHWWDNKNLPNGGWLKIVSIKRMGVQTMVDLQTSEHTYIANGLVSHNSTAVTGYFYHKTIMVPGTNSALIGYNSDLTSELLDKVKTFYATTPDGLKPTIQYNSKYEISFPKINSKIIVLPSTENVGRGYTLHNVLATELSSWEKADEKMMTLEASVPITGQIVIESTPKGMGNTYHRMFMSDKDYVKKEYGWWWMYTEEEIDTIRRRMNDPLKFAQEYELAFLSSGRMVFDATVVNAMRSNQLAVGDKVKNSDGTEDMVFVESDLRIYRQPKLNGFYVIGADVAEGVTGGDFSVATVWDRSTGEEVAMYRGLIAPDKFAVKLDEWGRRYNNALMVVEINNHGLTTVTGLKQLMYPSMYFRPSKFEVMGSPYSDKLGWKTTRMTRPLMIDDFGQALRDGDILIHSKELLDEMATFVYDKNNEMDASQGFHDDCIVSACVAFQGFKILSDKPMDQLSERSMDHISAGY